jgi:ubiquinone/menaquinone biosynthesis C-methylase UbiE
MKLKYNSIYDGEIVKKVYYDDIKKLAVRLKTWKKYGSNKTDFDNWLISNIFKNKNSYRSYLDAGCGTGQLIKKIISLKKINDVYGIDLSENMVIESRKKNKKYFTSIVEADINHLPFVDNKFDLITAIHVFHHLPSAPKTLNEIKRVCTKGGQIFITATDYQLNSGLNKLHYEALNELNFPFFAKDKKQYLHFNHKRATIYLDKYLPNYKIYIYSNDLIFKKVAPAMKYYESAMKFRNTKGEDDLRISQKQWQDLSNLMIKKINTIIAKEGVFISPSIVYGYLCKKK